MTTICSGENWVDQLSSLQPNQTRRITFREVTLTLEDCAALKNDNLTGIHGLFFDGCRGTLEAWKALFWSPLTSNLTEFGVRDSGFAGEVLSAFLSGPVPSSLQKLIITQEVLTFDDLDHLARGLVYQGLDYLSLPKNNIAHNALRGLDSARSFEFAALDLSHNKINSTGAHFLIQYFKKSQYSERARQGTALYLEGNPLSTSTIQTLLNNQGEYALHRDYDALYKMRKADLINIAHMYGLEVKRTWNKAEVLDAVYETIDVNWDMVFGQPFRGAFK